MGTDRQGSRVDKLVQGLRLLAHGNPRGAARIFGNFTLKNPTSLGAPAALFSAYYLAHWLQRPKAEKLKAALGRRYGETVFGKLALGVLPGYPFFNPGGRLKRTPPGEVTLDPSVTQPVPEPPTTKPPTTLAKPSKKRVTSSLPSPKGSALPPKLHLAKITKPPVVRKHSPARSSESGTSSFAVPALVKQILQPPSRPNRPPRAALLQLRKVGGRRDRLPRKLPVATPLPQPFVDHEPELDGSHMVDPESL
jgi:hypothetical protein